jgi:excisionase family DNA binding protein
MTPPAPDLSHWLSKREAATTIGVSTKTVETLAREGRLQMQTWRRPSTGVMISVYHPDDVERERAARNPGAKPFVMPADSEERTSDVAIAKPRTDAPATLWDAMVTRLLETSGASEKSVPISEKLFLTVPEAVAYSGLPVTYIEHLLKEGRLGQRFGRLWRIKRTELESYDPR